MPHRRVHMTFFTSSGISHSPSIMWVSFEFIENGFFTNRKIFILNIKAARVIKSESFNLEKDSSLITRSSLGEIDFFIS